jgi:hypothetical protein
MREKPSQQMCIWAMLCHLSALGAWMLLIFLVIRGIPVYLPLNILAPLTIWQLKKAEYPWIDFQGKESLNFQLSLTIYTLIIIILSLCLIFTSFGVALAANKINQIQTVLDSLVMAFSLLCLFVVLFQLVVVTKACRRAFNGRYYRYPFTIRFLQ